MPAMSYNRQALVMYYRQKGIAITLMCINAVYNETIRKQITDWVLFAAPVVEGLNQLEPMIDGHCSSRRWLWLAPDTASLQRVVSTQPIYTRTKHGHFLL